MRLFVFLVEPVASVAKPSVVNGWQRRIPWIGDVIAITTLLVAVSVVLADRFYFDAWLRRTDLLASYIPAYAYLGDNLRAFDIPGWNPSQFGGYPFAADPQSGWMYLPAMVFYAVLPPLVAVKAVLAFQVSFAALTMYAFARVLGMGPIAGLVAASVFALGSSVTQNTWCCTIWSQASTWIPLSLLGVELGLARSSWIGRAVGWSLAGIGLSQILAGWPGQGAYNAFLLVGGYLAFRAFVSPPVAGRGIGERAHLFAASALAVFGLGLGLGAAGLLPRLDVNQYTNLNLGSGVYSTIAAEDRGMPWEMVVDNLFSSGGRYMDRRIYIGGAAVALGLLAPVVARRHYTVPFFTLYSVVLSALVLEEFWLHRLFYLLPRYQDLHEHAPFRIWGLLMVGPAVLAGATVDLLWRWVRRPWAPLMALLPLGAIQLLRVGMAAEGFPLGRPLLYAAVSVSAVFVVAVATNWSPVRHRAPRVVRTVELALPVLLLLAVLWEPTIRRIVEGEPATAAQDAEEVALVAANAADDDPGGAGEFLQGRQREADQPFRYFGYDGIGLRMEGSPTDNTYQGRVMSPGIVPLLVSARATRLGLEDAQGYNPVQLSRYVALLEALNRGIDQDYHDGNVLAAGLTSPLLDLLNVRYIVVPGGVPADRPDLLLLNQRYPTVFATDRVRVLERSTSLPRAWIVHDARSVDDAAALELLATGAVDPRQVVLLPGAVPELPEAPPLSALGADSVTVSRPDEDRLLLTATTESPGLLTMSEIHLPGWQAYLDGERVDLLRANFAFRAVAIPAGTHRIELRYAPESLRLGLWISSMAGLLVLIVLVVGAMRPIWRSRAR